MGNILKSTIIFPSEF